MARARMLKPGFFRDEDLTVLPRDVRWLFAGLWTIADRAGRLDDTPRTIKVDVFPFDDDISAKSVDEWLTLLSEHGFVVRYLVDGRRFIQIVNFSKHQKPHLREVESVIPPQPKPSQGEALAVPSTIQGSEKAMPRRAESESESLTESESESRRTAPQQQTPAAATTTAATQPVKPRGRNFGRIYLHRWQLEELIDILGPHSDGFTLDEWVDGLSEKANSSGLTFASRDDSWDWVKAELAAEIARRGLPVASAASVTKVEAVRGCQHKPACRDAAEHLRRDMADRRRVG